MNWLEKNTTFKLLIISLLSAVIIIYPNIAFFTHERGYLGPEKSTVHLIFFIFRYLYFSILLWVLLSYNFLRLKTPAFSKRIIHSLLITTVAYAVYTFFSIEFSPKKEWISGILLFQFVIMLSFGVLIGHVTYLNAERRKREQEIEKLKVENLQSRFNALSNQINPHFFFNSLNGLTYLIRKKNDENTLKYVNKLSDVFRYILQSDKRTLVALDEELEFVQAFRYMMEVRFANKLVFFINVPDEKRNLKLPVLSLLPLIENVVMHNTIDSEHKMEVTISLNESLELEISNPIYPKLNPEEGNGTGIINLQNRFSLLMNGHIRVENNGIVFRVILPLKNS